MKMLPLLFVVIFWEVAAAQEHPSLFRQAEAHFQAKDYAQAQKLFQTLEKENFSPWQRARLMYNMGTVLLAEKKWNEALEDFSAIPFSPQKTPLLSRRLKTNTAALFFRQATDVMDKNVLTLDDYSRALYLYREALINIEAAQEADCIRQIFGGKKSCQASYDLDQWKAAIKTELARTTKAFGEVKIKKASPKEGLPFLLSEIYQVLDHIDFLKGITLNDKLKKRYRELILYGAESWLPLWDSQQGKMKEVDEPKKFFVEGLTSMKNDQLNDSRQAFLSSAESLSKLIQTFLGINPFFDVLRELLISYSRALDQIPLQAGVLYQLQTGQDQIQQVMEASEISQKNFSLSDENLMKSWEYIQQGRNVHARFYLQEARQWIYRLLREKTAKPLPDEILENAIQEQTHALNQNRLSQEMVTNKEDTGKSLQQSQNMVLEMIVPFFSAVIEKERKDYVFRCQDRPWDLTIPLFVQGRMSAEKALEMLEAKKEAIFSMPSQEDAIKYWRKALENMRHPREEKEEDEEEGEENDDIPKKPTPEVEQAPVQEVLRLLQQMEGEDRKPFSEEDVSPKKGARPW